MIVMPSQIVKRESEYEELRRRKQRLRRHIGCSVDMCACPDDLTADRGTFMGVRAGDFATEPAAIVEFQRNGRWAIPISLLYLPEVDSVHQETSAFVLAGRDRNERRLMAVSFEFGCDFHAECRQHVDDERSASKATNNLDAKKSSQMEDAV